MKIVFFGASVTQQKHGYVDEFAKLNCKIKVIKRGYGGMHLSNAGICFIDEILKLKPDICFIDWFSTSYNGCDGDAKIYLQTILQKLSLINCRVIFLFFPYLECEGKDKFYIAMKEYLREYKKEMVLVDEMVEKEEWRNLLRDTIHTTSSGSKRYAEIVNDYLRLQPKETRTFENLEVTQYSEIKKLKVKRAFEKKVMLRSNRTCYVVGFRNIIGRHSGIVEIKKTGGTVEKNLWDRWCYYTRRHLDLTLLIDEPTEIIISDKLFDTSLCDKKVDFNVKKKFVIDTIYYIGDELKIYGENGVLEKMDYGLVWCKMAWETARHILGIIWGNFIEIM